MHVISLCLILILNNSVSFCLFDVNSPGKIKCLLRCSIFIPFCICEYKFLISILHDSLIMGHIKFGKNWTSNHKRLSQMVLGINVFTKIIEVFWVHTALSFEECLQHCLGWFYNLWKEVGKFLSKNHLSGFIGPDNVRFIRPNLKFFIKLSIGLLGNVGNGLMND